ncbi:MAG: phosphodiesterase [Lachnospiraceae bacterium]|nr:phosphodiesterase [Lachnospiraceae bacterium]
MKWLIASDIHGSEACLEKLEKRMEEEKPDRILLLGDLLYHGARNALPDGYDTIGCTARLNHWKDRITAVRGNCDSEIDQTVLEFSIMSPSAVIFDSGLMIFATHGHLYDEHFLPPLGGVDVLLCGHTHVPACRDHGNFVYINPGSVSIPKSGSAHSYMTLENGTFIWKTLDGEEYRRFQPERRHG